MRKHKPPAQIRYEKRNPTVTFRVKKETKERIKNIVGEKSMASFIKEALGVREREKASLEREYKKGDSEGYKRGYEEAKRIYGVHGHCYICDEKMMITSEDEKKKIEMFLRDERFCHKSCWEEKRKEGF